LSGYAALGAKRASTFSQDLRAVVHGLVAAYRRALRARALYDVPELVAHIYVQLVRDGYQGVPITHVYRDEVQDFVQVG
jgi:hypothetical protein